MRNRIVFKDKRVKYVSSPYILHSFKE